MSRDPGFYWFLPHDVEEDPTVVEIVEETENQLDVRFIGHDCGIPLQEAEETGQLVGPLAVPTV